MTATNHVLTGAVIGLTIPQPSLAIIAAFISHFILDALPHYGDANHVGKRFINVLMADMVLALCVLAAVLILRPLHWQLAVVCAIAAASPDLMWLPMWLRELKHKKPKVPGWLKEFHKKIQWAESSHNYGYEILWGTLCLAVLVKTI